MHRRFFAVFFVAASLSAAFFACSGQGEGERCDHLGDNNGNDDCASGLVCRQASQLNATRTDRCCPPDPNQATTAVCSTGGGSTGAGGPAADAEAGAPEPTPDAASDAPTDASPAADANDGASDGGADAPTDAPDAG